ncbi:hybrid sensor histidine kinase/response regulator [Paenibacillus arenilitoris]|uniref:histidine kinase n=1 Tax=Paenibacillus arenilitoris TaxID=2772299 RepID=A0A927CJJ2_9BACL|nr:ATP-binding protein [Paenibacillus arenilitoris]MBD2868689.1 response regulator [Paenibacillus arenilitoris]
MTTRPADETFRRQYNKTLASIAAITLFIAVLLGMRWLWLENYADPDHPRAAQGVLDLRGFDLVQSRPISLNGTWDFYPGSLVPDREAGRPDQRPTYVRVPGDWRGAMPEGSGSSMGVGTYRLRILIDPSAAVPLAFRIQDYQAAISVSINGRTMAEMGHTGGGERPYSPDRRPFAVDYTPPPGTEVVELTIRVANFESPLTGGITKSVKFGTQAAIGRERGLSVDLQLIAFVVLLLHALYACILYFFNPRERMFLDFLLLLLAAAVSIVNSDDMLLLQWVPLNYAWAFKIRLLSYLWLMFFILRMAGRFSGTGLGNRWFRLYAASLILYSGFILTMPTPIVYYTREYYVFSVLYLLPMAGFFYLIVRMVVRNQRDAIFLLLSAGAILSSVIWSIFLARLDIGVSYPVDILAAIIGFSSYWFKRYFRNTSQIGKLNERLREMDKTKDRFLANTSHELRTPLHGIINMAQSIAERERRNMSRRSAEDLELLVTVGRQMGHLLNDLLDVVRLREKRIVLHARPLALPAVVRGVADMLNYAIEGKPVRMKLDMPASLPAVLADEKRLMQIVMNLLHNAIKYTEEGAITISAEIRDGRMAIEVADTGKGMDKETQRRVFIPYEQGDPGMSDARGIGLGLAIGKELAELHGGDLTVRSEPGKGSTFTLTLPLAGDAWHEAAPLAAAAREDAYALPEAGLPFADPEAGLTLSDDLLPPPSASAAKGEQARILAVDDELVNLRVLGGILESEPYNVRFATSANEALALLGSEQWDLLIADVMMPQLSGYELTRLVRERFSASELPVLLLTARSEPADVYAGFQAGASDYVSKPVDPMELKYRIRLLVESKRSVDERLRMEAAYMQAQIQPHFLFNTLNSIMALSEIDPDRMRLLNDAFSSYLRISFLFRNSERTVALAQELELVRAYLYVEKERHGDRLTVLWDVEEGVAPFLPPLSIQPLVENAVRHGILPRPRGGTVQIRIVRHGNSTLVQVEDDGIGMDEEKAGRLLDAPVAGKGGIGLYNTNRRLKRTIGGGLVIQSILEKGTAVSFVIPD